MTLSSIYATKLCEELNYKKIPVDPEEIAELKGIEVKEDNAEGYTGMLLVVDGEAMISVKRSIGEASKKRFTIAHEVGHYTIPGHVSGERTIFQCSDTDLNSFNKIIGKDKEFEANVFASELLLPENHFKKNVQCKDLNKNTLDNLCLEYETSLTATAIRFVTFRPEYALVYSEGSRIRWFNAGKDFGCYLDVKRGSLLQRESLAFNFFKGAELPTELEEVPSCAWINDYKDVYQVKELSLGSRKYNYVLSFIYVEKHDEDDDEYGDYNELDGNLTFRR